MSFEGLQRRKDGTTFPVEVRLTPVEVGGERMMLSLVRDISGRKQDEEALRHEQRLLRDMLDLHERDRQLVAYEIHDGLAQQLTGGALQVPGRSSGARLRSGRGRQTFRRSRAVARRSDGRDPPVDQRVAAARARCGGHRGGRRLPWSPSSDGRAAPKSSSYMRSQFERLAPSLEIAAFRIVQECLTNTCRYSKSRRCDFAAANRRTACASTCRIGASASIRPRRPRPLRP